VSSLVLCQIGPVQSFIAAGRRTQDLYVGSKLLSQLAAAGVDAAQQTQAELVFPFSKLGDVEAATVPHRFAFITPYEPASVAKHVYDKVMENWDDVTTKVRLWLANQFHKDTGDWLDAFERTKDNWIEFYWVAVEYDRDAHGASLKQANEALNQRKNVRHFPHISEPGWKCTLTGASSALPIPPANDESGYREMRDAWGTFAKRFDNVTIRSNEMLGTLALIKRFVQHAQALELGVDLVKFPSTRHIGGKTDEEESIGRDVETYYAILHMDGDKMGDKLSLLNRLQDHQEVSQALADFAQTSVPEIVRQYDRAERNPDSRAVLIYAGGDDVLALLPLKSVMACANDIRLAYTNTLTPILEKAGEHIKDEKNRSKFKPLATMSAGIAVVSSTYPLDMGLEIARNAEKSAKKQYGRDAVVITEVLGVGQRSAGAKWQLNEDMTIAGFIDLLIEKFQEPDPVLSTKLGFDIGETVAYALTGRHMEQARVDEVRRLVKRRSSEKLTKDARQALIDELAPHLIAWGEHLPEGWDALANWVIFARFLASNGKVRE